jgi:hypothetical protein
LIRVYRRIESGRIEVHTVETDQPSPLARAVIQAPPSGYLDPAEAEERRTRSFEYQPRSRQHCGLIGLARSMSLSSAASLEETLQRFVYLPASEGEQAGGVEAFRALSTQRVAFALTNLGKAGALWVHLDHLGSWLALGVGVSVHPHLPAGMRPKGPNPEEALRRIVLGAARRLRACNLQRLATETGQTVAALRSAAVGLQTEGLMRQEKSGDSIVWTERSIVAAAKRATGLAQTT